MKIPSSDRCKHCGHWSGDDEQPFRIYSEARARWLEQAAEQLKNIEGDDDWVNWMREHEKLTRNNE